MYIDLYEFLCWPLVIKNKQALIPKEMIERSILFIKGRKVMLDRDLAKLYGVKVKALIQAIKRNPDRFPKDFMFRLSWKEAQNSRSQFVTLKQGQNIKYLPHVFTEQGIAMLSSVLKSKTAIRVNIQIMRIFSQLRHMFETHGKLKKKIEEMEKKYDGQFRIVFDALRELLAPPKPAAPEKPKSPIGFQP
jgi:hypothetical protein